MGRKRKAKSSLGKTPLSHGKTPSSHSSSPHILTESADIGKTNIQNVEIDEFIPCKMRAILNYRHRDDPSIRNKKSKDKGASLFPRPELISRKTFLGQEKPSSISQLTIQPGETFAS